MLSCVVCCVYISVQSLEDMIGSLSYMQTAVTKNLNQSQPHTEVSNMSK